MEKLELPHGEYLQFAKYILEKQDESARVFIEFAQKPSLGMFIEAAAQSCAALNQDKDTKEGYLVALKNVTLHNRIEKKSYEVIVSREYALEQMFYIKFEVKDKDLKIVDGYLTIATH